MKESQEQNKIIFDKAIIFKSLDKFGEYKNEKLKTTIKKWEDDDITSNMFIIKIDGDCQFLGVINGLFEREGFGVNTYSNGDYYFGYFSENERNKHGIYSFKPKIENDLILSEYYYGSWKDNFKDGYGIYLWMALLIQKEKNMVIYPFFIQHRKNFYFMALLKKINLYQDLFLLLMMREI